MTEAPKSGSPKRLTPLEKLKKAIKFKDGDTRGIAKAFHEKWDADGNGDLDKREFIQGLKDYGVGVNDMTEAEKTQLWNTFDESGDGSISLQEFLNILSDVVIARQQLIVEGFDKLDRDKSGEVGLSELQGRPELLKYFELVGHDGNMSRLEWSMYCAAISSVCETNEEFQQKIEELTDVEPIPHIPWAYYTGTDPEEMQEWVNKRYPCPGDIMGGYLQGTFHIWVKPQKRSFIKGSYQYQYVYDNNFSVADAAKDYFEIYSNPDAPPPNPFIGTALEGSRRMLTQQGLAMTIDVDHEGHVHFLKVVLKPKRKVPFWTGKMRYLATTSVEELQAFLTKLEPQPENITCCCQKGTMHCFVNDIGQTGQAMTVYLEDEIPHDLLRANDLNIRILGMMEGGKCLYIEMPPRVYRLKSVKHAGNRQGGNPNRNTVRNPDIAKLELEGIYETDGKLQELFNRIDIDNSGFVSHAEFEILFEQIDKLGIGQPKRHFNRNCLDNHNFLDDDVLSFEEFSVLMLKMAQW